MDISQKSILDDIVNLLTKFGRTDESRLDEDYIYAKINQVRSQLIVEKYKASGFIDPSWVQDLGLVSFHKVNFADDASISSCECDISKAFIPQIITLNQGGGNQDLGLTVISSCGKTKYYPYGLAFWRSIPAEHERSKFHYFTRINNSMYVNKCVDSLRLYGVLQNPEDGKLISSMSIPTGSIQSGVSYIAKYGQVIYNGTVYGENVTFIGGAETSYSGNGKVYLASQAQAARETDKYPINGDMVRNIVIEILTKEFNIERQAIPDVINDSRDDAKKQI